MSATVKDVQSRPTPLAITKESMLIKLYFHILIFQLQINGSHLIGWQTYLDPDSEVCIFRVFMCDCPGLTDALFLLESGLDLEVLPPISIICWVTMSRGITNV